MADLLDVAPASGADDSVCVAVNLRPLIASELDQGSRECLTVTPGQPQISTGQHNFTYDHVFGGDFGQAPPTLYTKCVSPLVESLFKGYNATVFAYGQTGSGKTYTMGSEYRPGGHRTVGVIPEAIAAIFSKIAQAKDWQCSVRVSFVEIHKEEVRDLLVSSPGPRPAVSIREVMGGGVCLCGAMEREVRDQEEMASVLETGTLCRATASTNMNNRSSRSHAIFTITLEQRRQITGAEGKEEAGGPSTAQGREEDEDDDNEGGGGDEGNGMDDSYLCAKMHLVDLAGSERAKRTKAEGARLKEGIHINRGLLALGNVINAIVDQHKHVPYRDSKLTRLLQDSLGGNSRTVMIACVSPADINFEESLNTLRYADRARHIRNKPTINRDPLAAQVAHFRQQIAALKSENHALKLALNADGRGLSGLLGGDDDGAGTGSAGNWAVVDNLQQENSSLELENTKLKLKLENVTQELDSVKERSYMLQASLDRVTAQVKVLSGGESSLSVAAAAAQDTVVAGYVARIAELDKELRAARQLHALRRSRHTQHTARQANGASEDGAGVNGVPGTPVVGLPSTPHSIGAFSPDQVEEGSMGALAEGDEGAVPEEEMFYAEMAAHALQQEQMKLELTALQRTLEAKERRMAELQTGTGQVPALKQHYDRVLAELQKERDTLMAEKQAVMHKLNHLQHASEEERKKLEAAYKEKLATYDEKLKSIRKKEKDFVEMQRLKQRTDELCKRLSNDINKIKIQKVAIQKSMESNAREHSQWRVQREKEVTQLRKQARRSAAQIQALEAMQAKQNAVLQRKIADANAARKKLRELQGSSGADRGYLNGSMRDSCPSRHALPWAVDVPLEVQPNAGAPLLRTERARREWLEKELDLCNQSYDYRRVLDGELAQRAEANRQLRNVMKRLMMVNNLVPASPLVTGPNGCPTPCGPNQVGDVVVSQLLERRAQLERQLQDHNLQISELQAAWERAKSEEEGRGGGAADAKRWTLVRTIVEARELLKATFRLACDHKAACADTSLEGMKMTEEIDLLRVQLDAARKEADAQRKRAMAIEATAASAIATPYSSHLAGGTAGQGVDDNDREADDLLQQLHLATTPSGLARVHQGPFQNLQGALLCAADDEGVQLGSPDGSVDVSIEKNPARNRRSWGSEEGVVLKVEAPRASGSGNQRAGSVPRDEELQGRYPANGTASKWGAHELSTDIEDDYEEDEEEEEEEDEWDPSHATPARPSGRNTRRRSGSLGGAMPANARTGAGTSTRSRANSGGGNGSTAAAGRVSRGGGEADGAGGGLLRWGDAAGDLTGSQPASREGSAVPQDRKELEAQVLAHINAGRSSVDLAPKLTVPVLKESLRDWVMPDGKQWKAGSKTRDQLVSDYLLLMQSRAAASMQGAHLRASMQSNNAAPSLIPTASAQGDGFPTLGPLACPPVSVAENGFNHLNQLTQPSSPGGGSASRDYRAAVLSPNAMQSKQRYSHDAAGSPGNGNHFNGFQQQSVRNGSPCSYPVGAGGSPRLMRASCAAGANQASPRNSPGGGGTPSSTGGMTPMSLLYIQKAQEARKRMADMRQSMPRGAGAGGLTPGRLNGSTLSPLPPSTHGNGNGALIGSSSVGHGSAHAQQLGAMAAAAARREFNGRSPRERERLVSPSTSADSTPRGPDKGSVRASGSPLNTSGRTRGSIWK